MPLDVDFKTHENDSFKLRLDVYDRKDESVNLPYLYNFVGYSNSQTPAQMVKLFDYDFCKIFYDHQQNKLFIHSSLIFENLKNSFPIYPTIDPEFTIYSRYLERCLKYSLKGFYDWKAE